MAVRMNWLMEFVGEFFGTLLGHRTADSMSEGKSGSTGNAHTVFATVAGSELRERWFGLSRDDEAAFNEALAQLEPADEQIIVKRLGKFDRVQQVAFRRTLVKMNDTKIRAEQLRHLAALSDDDFRQTLEVTGFISPGPITNAISHLKTLFATSPETEKFWDDAVKEAQQILDGKSKEEKPSAVKEGEKSNG